MIRAGLSVLPRSSCVSWPPEADDFARSAPSVSPLEHAKGQKALDPAKNAGAFFRNKIIFFADYDLCRIVSPVAVQLRKLAAGGNPPGTSVCVVPGQFIISRMLPLPRANSRKVWRV